MIKPRWTLDRVVGAPRTRAVDELNELYRWTKGAQARAERHGFAGTAAALADIAAALAREHGLGSPLVQGSDVRGPAGRAGAPTFGPHGDSLVRH